MSTKLIVWAGLPTVVALIVVVSFWPIGWLEVVAGALISIWTTMVFSVATRPDLRIELYQSPDDPSQNRRTFAGRAGYARELRVVNKELHWALSWLQRNTATDVSGLITFRPLSGGSEIGPMPIRWSNTPQLHKHITECAGSGPPMPKHIADPDRLVTRQNILPGFRDDGVFGVASRLDGEEDAYGITKECYFTEWQPPDFRLRRGQYEVKVSITSPNASLKCSYLLVNEGELPSGFRLEEFKKAQ